MYSQDQDAQEPKPRPGVRPDVSLFVIDHQESNGDDEDAENSPGRKHLPEEDAADEQG